MLFGTNYPMLTAARALEKLDDLDLTPETRELFLGGNTARVFGLDSDDHNARSSGSG